MGYQALLFCADEKTARLVTQVLTELEFSVEPANEPFAAVKRLTTQHFDAVVVDCENEQNGALLFKTARNSGPNRTSLAVAVVEGQPGIAKAFRIGANLVLTKPINVEQSKGTLRVARGLLKKSDAAKPAAQPGAPVTSAPAVASRPFSPVPPRPVVPPRSLTTPPAPVVRAEATSNLELDQEPVPQPDTADAALLESMPEPVAPPAPRAATPRLTPKPAPWAPPKTAPSVGTAAGAAPAREVPRFESPETSVHSIADALPRRVSEPAPRSTPRAETAPAPILSAAQAQPSGGTSKGLIIGVVVVVLAAAGGYFGWTKLHSNSSTSTVQAPVQSAPVQSGAKPVASTPASTAQSVSTAAPESSAPTTARASAPPVEQEPEVVQRPVVSVPKSHESITVRSSKSEAAAEAPQALPVIGMVTGTNDKGLSGLVTADTARTPVLRTMKISQGVSQGLIIKRVAPDYPMQARQLRIEGAVQVEATISKEGNVSNVKVLGGHPILARAATEAIKQWKYRPYLLNSTPVEIETQITINFKLP
jgi:protein TonB